MEVKFVSLKLTNFKSHRDLEVKFGDLTKITGDNAQGKSSIIEAIPWVFYGTDVLGSKSDPTPTNYEFDYAKAELLVSLDDKKILLARGIEKGKAAYWINEVPSKATEFDELVKSLFDKDVFLSLFNPSFFFSLKWDEQRALLLRYVTAPANKEVFTKMEKLQADKLAELVKKHSLSDLDKIHRDNKLKLDKALIAAQSRTRTLQEQLDRIPQAGHNSLSQARAELEDLTAKIAAAESGRQEDALRTIAHLQARYESMLPQIKSIRDEHAAAKEQPIDDECAACGQELVGQAKARAVRTHTLNCNAIAAKANKMIEQAKAVKAELAGLQSEIGPVNDNPEELNRLRIARSALQESIMAAEQRQQLEQQIEEARKAEADTLASRNESVFIIDALKAFHAKEAELQAAKVQDLFTTLSLRLFKENKGDGEIKPDFEIMMDGKPYRKLSLSESIRAGLELREVLSQQAGIVAPCFVDNAESITRFKQPSGQLIVSRVIADQPLKIESEE